MIINDLDDYYIVFDTKNRNTELDTLDNKSLIATIINWVHLKKSRTIFFVFVTYWQSMARFRKNDFFKWTQLLSYLFPKKKGFTS